MATELLDASLAARLPVARSLLLIWQEPVSRAFVKVGQLDCLNDGRYAFRYLERALQEPGFYPLAEFPRLDAPYVSDSLPAFFANRVMNRHRSSYGQYREWLGLEDEGADTPFEVLRRTGGPRETDTFHVVDDLRTDASGKLVSRFFVSGIRHLDGADQLLATLRAGALLQLRADPSNPKNPRAILIDVEQNRPVGWVPDWLVQDIHALRDQDAELEAIAERCNPDAPPHLRLLCRISAHATSWDIAHPIHAP